MRGCEQSYFSTKLISTLFRPALRFFLRNVQESVLSEAKARPLEDLRLLLDERWLCLAQKHASFSPSPCKGHREHPVLLAYRFVVPRDQTSDVNAKPVGHFSDRR